VSDVERSGDDLAALSSGLRLVDNRSAVRARTGRAARGQVARDARREGIVIATKVGRLLAATFRTRMRSATTTGRRQSTPVFDFSYDGVMHRSRKASAVCSSTASTVLHIHDPDDHFEDALKRPPTSRSTTFASRGLIKEWARE